MPINQEKLNRFIGQMVVEMGAATGKFTLLDDDLHAGQQGAGSRPGSGRDIFESRGDQTRARKYNLEMGRYDKQRKKSRLKRAKKNGKQARRGSYAPV